MEYRDLSISAGRVESVDGFSLFIRPGITPGGQNDTDSRPAIPRDPVVGEAAGTDCFAKLAEVAFEAGQDHLAFGIPHAHIELKNLRPSCRQHQTGIENSLE